MKRFQPLVFSAALLFLAACGQDTQPEAAAPSFNFSIDPGSETVSLTRADAAALGTLQDGDGDSDEPRILFPDEELALTAYDAVFLPGNILEITAEFTNVTDCTFEQPFTFTRADSTSNIVSSQEPEVTDADLGGDGELAPEETTSTLTFTVEHMGQPFTYEVFAEAVVNCGDDGEGPGGPGEPGDDEADLEVVKTGDAEVTFGEDGSATVDFNVIVRNNGTLDAENVVLTDTLTIDLADLVGVEATITAGTPLPAGCVVDVTVAEGNVLICTIGTVAGGTEQAFDFSFDIDLVGELPATLAGVTITNTAEVVTDTEETDLENNVDVVVTVPADDGGPVEPGGVDLEVVKTAEATLETDADGNATLEFDVTVTNNGTVAATGVTLTDTLTIDLAGLLGVDATISASLPLPAGCVVDATIAGIDVLVCTIGDLAAGASVDLALDFDLDLAGDLSVIDGPITVTNTAVVTGDTDDVDDTNNLIEVDTAVTVPAPVVPELADLTVTKTVDATTVETDPEGNATLDFLVTVTNNGDAIAEGVELTDDFLIDLSALGGLVTLGATILPDDSNCIVTADATAPGIAAVVCPLGALASGQSSTLGFTLDLELIGDLTTITGPIAVTNTATVSTTTDEVELDDNIAEVEATVTVPDLGIGAAGM